MKYKIEITKYIMSFVFNTKDPLYKEELQEILSHKDYLIDEPISYQDKNIEITDLKIARRNNCAIMYDSNAPALFVAGNEPDDIYKEFSNIEKILIKELEIELGDLIKSYELISENRIKSRKTPQKMINKYYKDCMPEKFNEVFAEKNALFSIHIVPKGKTPLSSNWHDLLIRSASPRHYYIRLIYRNNNLDIFKDFAKKSKIVIEKTLDILEEN